MVFVPTDRMDSLFSPRCVWVNGPIIIGAGPSGLAVAASLREEAVPFVVLEREDCIASIWQKRTYDRLKLHLPKQFCELPRMPFPESYPEYPTRRQFIEYLENYAANFDVKPEFGSTVHSTRFDETSGLWRVHLSSAGAGEMEYIGRWLVVATGKNVVPDITGLPDLAGEVTYVSEYKPGDGESHKEERAPVVACGNCGMEVPLDLCNQGAPPSMVVRGAVLPSEHMTGKSPLWFVNKIMALLSWLILAGFGILRPAIGPLTRKNTQDGTPVLETDVLATNPASGIAVVPGVTKNRAELSDGTALDSSPTGGRASPSSTRWASPAAASADAARIARDLGQVWREETKPTRRAAGGRRRCISVVF